MPQPFSTRDDLKLDPLQEYFRIILDWTLAHRQTFLSVAGTLAVAAVVSAFIVTGLRSRDRQAWEKYNFAQTWAVTNNPQNALNAYDDVVTNFGRTPAAAYALLGKGDVLYQQKRYAEAVEAYKQCLAKDPPKIILPVVFSGLGAAQEDGGDFAGAIESYKQYTANFPDHMLAPKIYESLARAYEFSRNQDAAKEVYEKIITMFPDSFWAEKARGRYQALAPTPFQNAPAETSQSAPSKP